jgi:hypothetical protein
MINFFIKNKKAAEKYFSFWDLLMFLIIGTGIVSSVYVFSSTDLDIRENEAEILNYKIYDCLVKNGILISEFFDLDFNIYEKCGLNEDIFKIDNKFFFKIELFDNSNNSIKQFYKSFIDKSVECEINDYSSNNNLIRCFENGIVILFNDKGDLKKGNLKILTGSNNNLKNKNV